MFNFPSYGMVSVPWNAPDILRGIEAYQQHALSNLRFNIRKSSITDRIFWLNTQNGIPLFAYTPIKVYEELYERTIATKEGVGRHLVMNENESWVNLPSPIPETLWGDTYSNPRQKSLNDEARAIFEKGLVCGSIKERDKRYICAKTQDFDPSRYTFDVKSDLKTLYSILDELSDLKENGLVAAEKSDDQIIFNSTTAEEACEHFIRSPKLIALVKSENKKHEKLAAVLENLQALLVENDKEKAQIDEFLKTLVYDVIVKRGAFYIYEKSLEDDPWKPFVNLIDQADYPEYTMFQNYKALNDTQLRILQKKTRPLQEAWSEEKLIISLKKWQGRIAVRKNQLDKDMYKWPDGAKMYVFYRNVLRRLNSQVVAVEG